MWVAWGRFRNRWRILGRTDTFLQSIDFVTWRLQNDPYKPNPRSLVILPDMERPETETSIPTGYCWTDEDLWDLLRVPIMECRRDR